jgi:excisionase family DNA binding protein
MNDATTTRFQKDKEIMNVKEAAIYLGISSNTLYEAIKQGQMRGVLRVRGRILINRQKFLEGLEREREAA